MIECVQIFTPCLLAFVAFFFVMSRLDRVGLLKGEDVNKIQRIKATKPWSELTAGERLAREMTIDD